ncbi:MAG: hypothetical protein ABFS19_01040 [Thermodesulfobacteriota bacterium]
MRVNSSEIGFDFDGVIADTAEAFIRLACEEHHFCSFSLEDITSFEVENCLDMPADTIERIFLDILHDSLASRLRPMEGSVEVLSRMSNIAPVTIITARPLEKPVIDWLDHHFEEPAREKIRLVAMGNHDDKARYIHDHGLRYFIDDRSDTCRQLHAADIHPFVFSQPWNRGKHQFASVANWQEIGEMVGV